jgi:hypothetical protein
MLIIPESYLLATPPIVEHLLHLPTLLTACSAFAPVNCTLHSPLAAAPSSRSQYLALCYGGGYYHPNSERKILAEMAL